MIQLEIDDENNSSSSGDTIEECQNIQIITSTKKKRKSYKRLSNNPTFMPALRIFRTDIRRRYIEMTQNVLNNYDVMLHKQFFHDFAVPNMVHNYYGFPPEFLALLHHSPNLVGMEQVLHTYEMHYLMIPDIVFTYDDIKICKRLGSPGSRIVATVRASGKMQFALPMTSDSDKPSDGHELSPLNVQLSPNYSSKPIFVQRLPEPVDFKVAAIVTMTLDDEHRYVSVELQAL